MISIAKKKLMTIAEILHLRIFGHEMSEEMRKFLGHLSWSFMGGVTAAAILFILNVFAGRFLGPTEYGKYNLVILMSQLFIMPMVLGMDASVLWKISRTDDNNEVKSVISSTFLLVLFLIFSVSLMIFFNREFVADIFSTNSFIVLVAVVFSASLSLKAFFDGIIKGLSRFRFQAIMKSVEAVTVFSIFFILIFLFRSYLSFVISLVVAGLMISFSYALRLRDFFGKPDIGSIRKVSKYAKLVVVGSIMSIVMGYGDRFIVNRYFGSEELGIYSAYCTATILIASQFIVIISNVFFTMIASVKDKKVILEKLDRMFFLGMVPAVLSILVVGFIVLKLFGNAYAPSIEVLFLFSVVASLQFFVSFYANVVNAHNEETYFWGLLLFFVRTFIYVLYILLLIKFSMVSIVAILIGLIGNYVADIFNLRYIIKKYA